LGVAQFRAALSRHRRIGIDTNIFIYQLEATPKYLPLTDCVFSWLEFTDSAAVTSTVAMIEVLVKPYRESAIATVDKCRALLSIYPNLAWISPGLALADLAAEIRATHRLRTPDAIQTATALQGRATAIVTNDPIFRRVVDLDVLVLDDYV
jgi:predicted nucleic acid-binding protein